MTTIADHPALAITLGAAVPLWIHKLAQLDEHTRDQRRMQWASESATIVGSQGDALQYGGKRGQAAAAFNGLARGLAALAYAPGGVTFAGEHWCVDHAACLAAELAAAAAPLQPDQPGPNPEPAVPAYQGRPIVDVELPGVTT